MKTFDIFPTVQSRIWAGIFFFTGTMILLAWIIINEDARMTEFAERFDGRSVETGAKLFEDNCATCHGPEGYGLPNAAPALNNPKLLEFSFFESIDTELASIDRQLEDPLANGLTDTDVANLQARRAVLMLERRDIEEKLLYWYEPEQVKFEAELLAIQLAAYQTLNEASIPPVPAVDDETETEPVDVAAILTENALTVAPVGARITPEYLIKLSDDLGEDTSETRIAELTDGLTIPNGEGELVEIPTATFLDWHNQIVNAQNAAADAQTRFGEALAAASDELGVSPEELALTREILTYTEGKSSGAQATFDNLNAQVLTEFNTTEERLGEFRTQVAEADSLVSETLEARLTALDASAAAASNVDATDEQKAALEDAAAAATEAFNNAEEAYNTLINDFATEFASTPERLEEVYSQLAENEVNATLYNALLREIADELNVSPDRLNELNTELNTIEDEVDATTSSIRTVANTLVRSSDIRITAEMLESLHQELTTELANTFLPEVATLQLLNQQIKLMVNFSDVSPAGLATRTSIIEGQIQTITEAQETDTPFAEEVLAFKEAELGTQSEVAAAITDAADKASRFERLTITHNDIIRLRGEITQNEARLAAFDPETTRHAILSEIIDNTSNSLESQEESRMLTQEQMASEGDIVPYRPMPYPQDPTNPNQLPFLYRADQMSWTGTLDSFIKTTLISGRPGSGQVWTGSSGMAAWSQEAAGPLRNDQIENLVDYILNWDREFTIADVRRIQQYAFTPGEGSGTAATGSDLGNDPVAIIAQVEADAIMGDAARGEDLFSEYGCSGCHLPNGGGQGPALNGLYLRAGSQVGQEFEGVSIDTAEHYLVQSILAPNAYRVPGYDNAQMPLDFRYRIPDVQSLWDIVTYLQQFD